MKNLKFISILAVVIGLLILAGCGRNDVTITVNKDGSFHANVTYGIEKALMGNAEVQDQVKALITDTLDQNNVPYIEGETEEYVTITVERDFADLNDLVNEDSWRGIGMVPGFSRKQEGGKLWLRYEDNKLKLDGTLDAASFDATELVSQGEGMNTSFGGSLTFVLPEAAEEGGGNADTEAPVYSWIGTAGDTIAVSLTSAPMPEAAAAVGNDEAGENVPADDESQPESSVGAGSRVGTLIGVIALIVLLLIIAVVIAIKKRKTPAGDDDKKIE
ncbi:MAG: hypothetical protein J1F63_02590 [Oscillospiraceae bacterium]|nr:hypothetical protein [Oscillospiraceae bacterium]